MRTVKVYQYRVRDPATGRRYLPRYKLTEEEAAKRYPEGERQDVTEQTRTKMRTRRSARTNSCLVLPRSPDGQFAGIVEGSTYRDLLFRQ